MDLNSKKRHQTPRNLAMTAFIENTIRIYKKTVKNEENAKSIEIKDVMDALKTKYSDLEIVKNVVILTNTYNRIWTIVFKSSFEIDQLK